ncbi:MAG: hypothetical protein R6W75_13250, partial [Smithellaceae bacterium]
MSIKNIARILGCVVVSLFITACAANAPMVRPADSVENKKTDTEKNIQPSVASGPVTPVVKPVEQPATEAEAKSNGDVA